VVVSHDTASPGLFPNVSYEELSLRLKPGDTLLFCTDGVTDARDTDDQEFGLEGLQEVCVRHASAKPLDLLEQIFTAIQRFTQNCRQCDDMAAAVFHYSSRADNAHVAREKRSDFSI
jgi:phosphoserine phosphatase RsbU/P